MSLLDAGKFFDDVKDEMNIMIEEMRENNGNIVVGKFSGYDKEGHIQIDLDGDFFDMAVERVMKKRDDKK